MPSFVFCAAAAMRRGEHQRDDDDDDDDDDYHLTLWRPPFRRSFTTSPTRNCIVFSYEISI